MKAKIHTKGMHCPSCEVLIVDELEDQDGVKSAKANHKSGVVEVEFDDKITSTSILKSVIKSEGYEVE